MFELVGSKTDGAIVRSLEDKIHRSEVDMPTNYVRKDELSSHLNRIESMLNKIFERLEQKADKP